MKDYHNRANFSSILMHSMSTIFSCLKSKTTLNQSNCSNQFYMHGRTAGFSHLQFGQETAAWQVAYYNYISLEILHSFHDVREVAELCMHILVFCYFWLSHLHFPQWTVTALEDFTVQTRGTEFPSAISQHFWVQ